MKLSAGKKLYRVLYDHSQGKHVLRSYTIVNLDKRRVWVVLDEDPDGAQSPIGRDAVHRTFEDTPEAAMDKAANL